jgi:hypothetical protein
MRRLVILAALAMGPGSIASAQTPHSPYWERERYGDRDYNRDYTYDRDGYYDGTRYDDGYYDRDGRRVYDYWNARRRWTPLAQENGASNERQFINVAGRGGRFNRLLVEGVRGAPVIHRVAVEFEDWNGRATNTQVWDVHRRLPRGADQVIDLGGRKRIHRIIVYTEPSHRGAYSIYGA